MEKKGVSPVVGTILLIAITVALAAIVAMLVSGLGGRGAPPSAMLSVTAEASSDNNYVTIMISHNGGDDLILSELQLQASTVGGMNTDIDIVPTISAAATLSVGGTATGTYDYENTSPGNSAKNTAITVYIIHVPSKQKLFSSTSVIVQA